MAETFTNPIVEENDCEKAKKSLKHCINKYIVLNDHRHDPVRCRVLQKMVVVSNNSTDYYKANIKSLEDKIVVWESIVKIACSEKT